MLLMLLFAAMLSAACQKGDEQTPAAAPPPAAEAPAPVKEAEEPPLPPPMPPVKEDFEGEPKLSLFPRVGDFAPERDDQEKMGYWATFIDHLVRTSGPVKRGENRGFALRGIKTIQSVGFFSPLGVEPASSYRVSFRQWGNLPKGAVAGVGALEFNEFFWIADQFPRSFSQEHLRGAHEGVRLTGKQDGKLQTFTFKTGPETRMIHLVLFLEGEFGRDPILFDDIEIEPAPPR
jgi:hypothetical protein